jgi:hypothetical protein
MQTITLTTENYTKKAGTKTVWALERSHTETVDMQVVNNIKTSASFFRRLGGSVTQTFGYTSQGYCLVRDVSTSPDKQSKTVRLFAYAYTNS